MRFFTYHMLVFWFLVFAWGSADAQNPFDLQHRLDADTVVEHILEDEVEEQEIEIDSQAVPDPDTMLLEREVEIPVEEDLAPHVEDTLTPLDIEEIEEEEILEEQDEEVKDVRDKITKPDEMKDRSNLLLLIFLLVSIVLAFVIAIERSVMDKIYRSIANENFLNYFLREQKGAVTVQLLFLYFIFLVNAGLFLLLFLEKIVQWDVDVKLWQTVVFVAGVYLARYLCFEYLKLFAHARKELNRFYFTIYIFNIFIGLVLLPLNAFAAFAPEPLSIAALYFSLAFFILMYLFRQLRGLFIGSKFLIANQFHFFIYLCTVEIAPLLILGRYFVSVSS
ncbi:MAG: DUF4271 domain-containing protein [Saprospirales bacterium]|nr:MAG: DUF4271 domain-containing protein [Saprospirales bacterium]